MKNHGQSLDREPYTMQSQTQSLNQSNDQLNDRIKPEPQSSLDRMQSLRSIKVFDRADLIP
jgi:hypothetical protein